LHWRRAEVVVNVAALLAVAAALAAGPVYAQESQPSPNAPQPARTPTFRSGSALVALNVTVQDRGAKFVRDLQPGDFVVYEDGIKQAVEFFESSRVPVDLIVLIDTSASMRDKLDTVHDAASAFMKTLRPEDRGAVVTFANTVMVAQPLTGDQALLQEAIRSTQASGNTCLNNAVYIALKQFGQAAQSDRQVRRQAVVVLSDGADTASLVSFDSVVDLARHLGVSIYTVSLQTRAPNAATRRNEEGDAALKTLAKETGAQSFFPMPRDLKHVYATIATELASQYSIGYVPANNATDGRFRRVNVQVVTRPQVFSRTRLGYIAAAVSELPLVRRLGGSEQR
jgi:Ca-activated chloride channel family protein